MLPKTIWLLWFQGWENAPELVKQVRQSWQHHNPCWKIMSLDQHNLKDYLSNYPLPNTTDQAKSDIIRLDLLSTHGGVWADATMVCMQPLDTWVEQAVEPSGMWMYHGRDKGRGPASWFILSSSDTYIIKIWNESCKQFWSTNPTHVEYFWMDRLFAKLAMTDEKFFEEWKKVPHLYCEDYGSAHAFAGKVYQYHPEIVDYIKENPPFAIKLCKNGQMHPQTNAWHILQIALNNIKTYKQEWNEQPSFQNANFFES